MAYAREQSEIIIIIFLIRILFKVLPPFYNLRMRAIAKCQFLKKKKIFLFKIIKTTFKI